MATPPIGNIDLSRGQPPYNPNMGEYLIPANRSFTWETSPQEQGLLASAMGRPDLSALMATGQWGPLAGQPYQYQGGRTTIGYGGGGGMDGYPGGYPGGGFPPWQTGDYPPWQGQPPWQPPVPPRVPPTIGDPFDPTPPDRTRPTTPFDVDPNKWTAPTAGGFVYDPNSVIPEFDQWSMWENQRIRDQNARIQRFQDPTSDINLNFAFEDAKRRGALPTTPLQDKAAFMAMTDANRGRQASVMPDDFGSGNPFADAQRAERQRSAAIQAEQERARMGFGVTPFTPIRGLGQEDTTPTFDQLAGRQERMRLEAQSRARAAQQQAVKDAEARRQQFTIRGLSEERGMAAANQAVANMQARQQAAGNAQRVAEANRVQAQRASAERQRQAVTQSQQREESRGRAEQERKAVVSQKAAQRRKAVEAKSRARATAPKPAPNRQAPVRLATPTRIKPTTAGRQTGAAQRAAAKARQVAQQKAGAAKAAKSRTQAAARARNIAQERKDKKRGRRGPGKGDR